MCIHCQIGAGICTVPTADAVATSEVNLYNFIGQSQGLWKWSAKGTVVQCPLNAVSQWVICTGFWLSVWHCDSQISVTDTKTGVPLDRVSQCRVWAMSSPSVPRHKENNVIPCFMVAH